MNKLSVLGNKVVSKMGSKGLVLKKHSPEILVGVGVVGVITSTVLACRATLKLGKVVDEAKFDFERIEHSKDLALENDNYIYSEEDQNRDKTLVYVQSGVKIIKAYLPAVIMGSLSIACIMGGHNILKKRNVAIMAAYKTVDESYKKYRERVVNTLGEAQDRQFKYGVTHEKDGKETVIDPETGKEKKVDKLKEVKEYSELSEYAVLFDESNSEWQPDPTRNKFFLKSQQNYFNDKLQAQGFVFLNEVYYALGFPRTAAGQVIGWLKDSENGDNFIDFGIFDRNRESTKWFVNNLEQSVMLDFNVDGVMYDLI